VDTERFDALARTLTPGSRRSFLGTLAAVAGSALAPLLTRDDAAAHDLLKKCKKINDTKKKKACVKKAKKHNSTHAVPPLLLPPPPRAVTVACPDSASSGQFAGFAQRFAQTFTAPGSGQLTSAQAVVTDTSAGDDFVMEIRTLDNTGTPTTTVLASAAVFDVPAVAAPQTRTLTGIFTPPAPVVAAQSYALVLTGIQGSLVIRIVPGDTCPGQHFRDSQTNETFTSGGTDDMVCSVTISV
jgi:hypothetical protein